MDSGLNSVVLANRQETILLPLNEPTFGTKKKSQIQTYLEQYQGEGVQHIALATNDIFTTLKKMRQIGSSATAATTGGVLIPGYGFQFMRPPPPNYYDRIRKKVGSQLSEEQILQAKELGILIDKDDQGILLQIFTEPVGDRPTVFLEIIQVITISSHKSFMKSLL